LRVIIQVVDKASAPSLLPIFRSQQQAELLALVLGDSILEHTMTDLAERTGVPYPSVHREIERALAVGFVSERLVGRTRVIRADTTSPYFAGLSDVLVKAFGPPWVIGRALLGICGIAGAYIYGSWAAWHSGSPGDRPVGDIDLLVLGNVNREEVYAAASSVEGRLGRPVQVTIRSADWLAEGSGTFHDTVASRPMVPLLLDSMEKVAEGSKPEGARRLRQQPAKSQVPKANLPR
jgi:hypothetical protein